MSCSDCFKGHDRPGAITGVETHLHGVKSYVTQPTQDGVAPKGLIVVISDAFGWKTNNIRLLADSYARRTGCRVYVPDFMDGKGWNFFPGASLPHEYHECLYGKC